MGKQRDWWSTGDWSPDIAEDFELRLKRSTSRWRPEYLQAKAVALLQTRRPDLIGQGRLMVERYLREFPEHSGIAGALECVGDAFRNVDAVVAEQYFRRCLATMPPNRNRTSGTCHLSLAELLLDGGRDEDLAETEKLIEQFAQWDSAFFLKSSRFRYLCACARLAARLKDQEKASELAKRALDILHDTTPQLPRLPQFGAPSAEPGVLAELNRLAGNSDLVH